MPTGNYTSTFVSIQTPSSLEDRIRIEASRQQHDLRESYAYVSKLPNSRLVRHAVLVNARHVLAYDVITFYAKRYGVTPVSVRYGATEATRDILAAGLPYSAVRPITRDAGSAGMTGESYRTFVAQEIAAWKHAATAQRAKNAAKLQSILERSA